MAENLPAGTDLVRRPTTDIVSAARRRGDVALVTTVHEDLDTVVGPDGERIIGVSQRSPGERRKLDLQGVVAAATDIVAQPGADARHAYGQVYVVVGRPDGQGGQILQETLIDYPKRQIITNPGLAEQRVYPADGLPQSFTTNRPYRFVPSGGDPSHPKTSNGTVLAAYMHAPQEEAAVPTFDPAAIARGDFAGLTRGFFDPAKPLAAQGLQEAFVAERDPIAEAAAAAQRVMLVQGNGPRGTLR